MGGHTVVGDYRINGRLGAGGMGVVFDATDLRLGRRVALKVISHVLADNAEFWLRFEREAQVLARLDSPHVTKIYEYGEHEGARFIATQLVAGGDLRQLINKRGPLPPQLAARVCAQVSEALRDAHAVGVVHRDVKPANVLIRDPDADLHAYLCDFGIAATESQGLTATGAIAGTWTYLAPERIQGESATPASDIYALGCLLWAALTGRPPYTGADVDVALAHLNAPVPQLAGKSPIAGAVNRVLARTLAKDPGARYPDAGALAADLRQVSGLPADGFTAEDARTPQPRRRRRALVAALATLALVVATTAIWLRVSGGQDGQADPSGPTPAPTGTTSDAEPEKKTGVTADYNGDGYGDLSIRMGLGPSVLATTLTSDGARFAVGKIVKTLGGQGVRGDLDGDGLTDRVVVDWEHISKTVTISVAYGDGESAFLRKRMKATEEESRLVAGDFDGDGKTDLGLALHFIAGSKVRLWMMRGTADGLTDPRLLRTFQQDRPAYDNLVPGDYDGDGDDDLAVVDRPDSGERAEIFLGTSDGSRLTLASPLRVADTGFAEAAAAGDFDGDGTDELVLATYTHGGRAADGTYTESGFAEQLLTVRDGRFVIERSVGLKPAARDGSRYENLVAGDFDGDGRDDLARFEPGSQIQVWVYPTVAENGLGKVWATVPCRQSDCEYPRATDTDTGLY